MAVKSRLTEPNYGGKSLACKTQNSHLVTFEGTRNLHQGTRSVETCFAEHKDACQISVLQFLAKRLVIANLTLNGFLELPSFDCYVSYSSCSDSQKGIFTIESHENCRVCVSCYARTWVHGVYRKNLLDLHWRIP